MRANDLFKQYQKKINPPYKKEDLFVVALTLFLLIAIPLTVITAVTNRDTRSRASVVGAYSEMVTIIHKDIESKGFGDVDIIKKVTENSREKIFLNGKLSSQKEVDPVLKKAKGEVLGAATCPDKMDPLIDSLTVSEGVTFCIYTNQVTAQDVYDTFKTNGLEGHVKLVRVDVVDEGGTMASVGGGCYPLDYPVQGCWVFNASIQIREALLHSEADATVAHEYGHVWDNYYKWTNWRGEYDAYFDARGLVGDPRLDSGAASCWNPIEIVAEDYRALFGKDAADTSRCNRNIPHPSNVPDFNEFLALTYTNNSTPPNYIPTPTDMANPTVTFTDPANGSTLTGDRVVVFVEALDDVAVYYIELYVDGNVFAVNAVNLDLAKGVPGFNDYRFLLNSTKLANGNHTFQAKAYDLSGKSAMSSNLTPSVSNTSSSQDTQEPTISIISPIAGTTVSDSVYIITSNSDDVGITKTELLVDNQLEVTDIIYPYALKIDTNNLTNGNHSFVVKACDWAGNIGTSGSVTFNVNNENTTPDTQNPVVTITAPANGATVSNTVTITATATDNVGVTKVEFYVAGDLKSTDTASPYLYSWDTTTVSNGSRSLQAKAYDAANNNNTDEISITVANGDSTPPSAPTNLTATAASSSEVNLSWTASTDNVDVTGYWVVRDGVTIANTTNTGFSDTSVSPNTTYSYQVIAYDAAGNNSGPSNTATVTTPQEPDTQPPSAPTNLTATAASSTQINLSWNASTDNVSIAGYEVYRGGSKIVAVTTTSYGDTGLNPSTTYSYYVKAKDAAGNTSAASNTASAKTQDEPTTQGTLVGLVANSNTSNPLVGALIKVTIPGKKGKSAIITTATTNSSGIYAIDLKAGSYNVQASKSRYKKQTKNTTITAGGTTTVNFSLTPTGKGKKK
jgi:chitodextrinase